MDVTTVEAELLFTHGINSTEVVEKEEWRKILEITNTVIMTSNTIFLMLGMGAAISIMDLWAHVKRPVGAVIGMTGQFIVLPAIGFMLSTVFQLRPYEALGVLLISCSPGGTFSNFFTFWVDGDIALSIMMTGCSSILAFGGMPFNLWIYGRYWQGEEDSFVIPFANIIGSLFLVSVPAIAGMTVRYYHERVAGIIVKVASIVAWSGVVGGSTIWLILYWQTFALATPMLYLAAALLPSLGFIFAFILAKLTCQNNKVGRTIGIETSSQNMPVAISIILLSFNGTEIIGDLLMFPTLYGVVLICEAIVLIILFRLYKKFCTNKDYPEMHTARVESATTAEKQTFILPTNQRITDLQKKDDDDNKGGDIMNWEKV